jgi:hypothetical protein
MRLPRDTLESCGSEIRTGAVGAGRLKQHKTVAGLPKT